MNWKKVLGYGALIWVVAYLAICALVGLGVETQAWVAYVGPLLVLLVGWYAAGQVAAKSVSSGLGVGVVWVIEFAILDYLLTIPFVEVGTAFFTQWHVVVGYVLALVLPALRASTKK